MQRQREHILVVTEGPNVGQRYQLREMVSTFGRTAGNTIVFDSTQISRHHAHIRLTPDGAVIEDTGSTNGTWVNGRRLAGSQALTSGDRIRFADYVTLEYGVTVKEPSGTEVLPSAPSLGATEALSQRPIGGAADFDDVSQRPAQRPSLAAPVSVEPYVPAYQEQAHPVRPAPAAVEVAPGAAASDSRRPKALYVVIGILVVLICLCIALATYLWFAPLSFWERIFDLLGIPLPTGAIVSWL